jgi:hypothetical protein
VKEDFRVDVVVEPRQNAPEQEIDIALTKVAELQLVRDNRNHLNRDSRILAAKSVDHCWQHANDDRIGCSHPNFADGRINQEFYILYCLAQIIEYRRPAIEQGQAILRWFDSLVATIKETDAEGLFQFGY